MERIKHHFCWVKTVAGSRGQSTAVSNVGLADMRMAWAPGDQPAQAQPQQGGVPPPNSLSSPVLQPQHAGVPPPRPRTLQAALEPRHGGVPPPIHAFSAGLPALVPPPPPVEDPEASIAHGPVPPPRAQMIFAGATMAGAWAFDPLSVSEAEDDTSLRHEFQVVVGDRAEAYDWLSRPEGRAWAADAKAITLVTFAVMGIF